MAQLFIHAINHDIRNKSKSPIKEFAINEIADRSQAIIDIPYGPDDENLQGLIRLIHTSLKLATNDSFPDINRGLNAVCQILELAYEGKVIDSKVLDSLKRGDRSPANIDEIMENISNEQESRLKHSRIEAERKASRSGLEDPYQLTLDQIIK
tara:strand:- start:1242 stop:1700 length:459 start_codon:yes stop_codon:yes gene_type:complete